MNSPDSPAEEERPSQSAREGTHLAHNQGRAGLTHRFFYRPGLGAPGAVRLNNVIQAHVLQVSKQPGGWEGSGGATKSKTPCRTRSGPEEQDAGCRALPSMHSHHLLLHSRNLTPCLDHACWCPLAVSCTLCTLLQSCACFKVVPLLRTWRMCTAHLGTGGLHELPKQTRQAWVLQRTGRLRSLQQGLE